MVLKAQGRILTGWTKDATYPANAGDPPASPLTSTVAGSDTAIELIPYGSAKLRVTEMPWINTPVGVRASAPVYNDHDLQVTVARSGKCLLTVRTPGVFDLELLDIAGRRVFHRNAEGPLSFVLEKGVMGRGTYIVHLGAGGRILERESCWCSKNIGR